jgi:hypothetical protein
MVTVSCRLAGAGTIQAGVSDGVDDLILWPTYLSNAPADLERAVVELLQGARQATCSWQDELGQYRWLFERRGEELEIKILWFEETFSRKPDEQGELRFSTRSTLRGFAAQVHAQLGLLIGEGAAAYRREWRHDFPFAVYERLGELIRQS